MPRAFQGALLRRYRKEAGLSVKELSERSGVKTSSIYVAELNYGGPSLKYLVRMADAIGRPIDDFFAEEDTEGGDAA